MANRDLVSPSFGVPYAAPPGYTWDLSSNINGFTVPTLVPDRTTILEPRSAMPVATDTLNPSVQDMPTPIAPQMMITFDTIGQTIFSTMGHSRMPLRYLWVQGITNSGDVVNGTTITFAAALCAPIDPLEEGTTFTLYEGAAQVYTFVDGITPPSSWDPIRQALLVASLATAVIYPGTEGQDPDPTIIADKGAGLVSGYRGLRYIVLRDYPATSLPNLSAVWQRTNEGPTGGKKKKPKPGTIAVEFAAGAS
jgi:hypothetical protein